MHNLKLIEDYILRAGHRMKALQTLYECESYADVVREAQKIIELCLKAFLRKHNIDSPRTHDVSQVLLKHQDRFENQYQQHIPKLAKISKALRRDRELAYYGSEDLTPSEFYQKEDGDEALEVAKFVYDICKQITLDKSL